MYTLTEHVHHVHHVHQICIFPDIYGVFSGVHAPDIGCLGVHGVRGVRAKG
jgi:hypothetical protein